MDQKIIDRVIEKHGTAASTARSYESVFTDFMQYEKQTSVICEDDPEKFLRSFVDDKMLTDALGIAKYIQLVRMYMKEYSGENVCQDVRVRDFDLSNGMIRSLVPDLFTMLNRCKMRFAPENGDGIFPLVSFCWMGLTAAQSLQVLKNDINLRTGEMQSRHPLIFDKLPQECLPLLQTYAHVSYVVRDNRQKQYPDQRPEFIYKTVGLCERRGGTPIGTGTYGSWIIRVREAYNAHHSIPMMTTYQDVTKSAMYFKARQLELSGVDWDDDKHKDLLRETFRTSRLEPTYLRYNYQMYKKAFGLK